MNYRVVITGLGVVSPNANTIEKFEHTLRQGISGILYHPCLQQLNFICQVAGVPEGIEDIGVKYFTEEHRLAMNSSMLYAAVATVECWRDAGFQYAKEDVPTMINLDTSAIVGTGVGGFDTTAEKLVPGVNAGRVRRLDSTMIVQWSNQMMASTTSAKIGGLLGGSRRPTLKCCLVHADAAQEQKLLRMLFTSLRMEKLLACWRGVPRRFFALHLGRV